MRPRGARIAVSKAERKLACARGGLRDGSVFGAEDQPGGRFFLLFHRVSALHRLRTRAGNDQPLAPGGASMGASLPPAFTGLRLQTKTLVVAWPKDWDKDPNTPHGNRGTPSSSRRDIVAALPSCPGCGARPGARSKAKEEIPSTVPETHKQRPTEPVCDQPGGLVPGGPAGLKPRGRNRGSEFGAPSARWLPPARKDTALEASPHRQTEIRRVLRAAAEARS